MVGNGHGRITHCCREQIAEQGGHRAVGHAGQEAQCNDAEEDNGKVSGWRCLRCKVIARCLDGLIKCLSRRISNLELADADVECFASHQCVRQPFRGEVIQYLSAWRCLLAGKWIKVALRARYRNRRACNGLLQSGIGLRANQPEDGQQQYQCECIANTDDATLTPLV